MRFSIYFSYETFNTGIKHHETTSYNGEHMSKSGEYSYMSPDNQHIRVVYKADHNGFVPEG
jgi:hypothetical protein